MRFSTASALVGLPLMARADLGDYKAQFQNFLGKFTGDTASAPSAAADVASHPVEAAEVKIGEAKIEVLTLDNWKETLYSKTSTESTAPVDVWVLITGGNKTCFGHCEQIETAYNKSSAYFAVIPNAPYTALLNCDNEPVLCNAWSAPAGALWAFEMLPEPAPINIYTRRLNFTTTTVDDILELQKTDYKATSKLHDGYFHPFNGPLAQYGLNVPVGYALWAFNLVPSWMFMVLVSMFSRSMMSNRVNNQVRGQAPAAGAAPAAPAAAR